MFCFNLIRAPQDIFLLAKHPQHRFMLNVIFSFPTDNKEINTLRLLCLMGSADSDRKKFGRRRASVRVGRARLNIPHFTGFSFQ